MLVCAVLALACALAGLADASTTAPHKIRGSAARQTLNGTSCQKLFGSFGPGHWPPGCWRPYGPRSPFNRRIPARPRLSPESGAIVSYFAASHWSFDSDHHGNFEIGDGGSRPVYWSRASDPVVRVVCRPGFDCHGVRRLHLPAGARPQAAGDGHMTVMDQANRREYDFWRASGPEGGVLTVSAAVGLPIGPGRGTGLGGAAEAAQLGLAGGLIRGQELMSGRIDHALATTVPCVQPIDVWPSPRWGRGDLVCGGGHSGPHFGSLLQLAMSSREIASTRAPRWQRAVMLAMARYGIYVVDTDGPGETVFSLLREDELSYTSFGYPGRLATFIQQAGGHGGLSGVPIPISKLRVIDPCVPRGTC